MSSSKANKEKAEKLKTEADDCRPAFSPGFGNAAFARKNYQFAISKYTAAIQLDPENNIFYSNRANCYVRLEEWQLALLDAQHSIRLNPKFTKAYVHKAKALTGLTRYHLAKTTYNQLLAKDSNNEVARLGMDQIGECIHEVRLEMGPPKDWHSTLQKLRRQKGKTAVKTIPNSAGARFMRAAWNYDQGIKGFKEFPTPPSNLRIPLWGLLLDKNYPLAAARKLSTSLMQAPFYISFIESPEETIHVDRNLRQILLASMGTAMPYELMIPAQEIVNILWENPSSNTKIPTALPATIHALHIFGHAFLSWGHIGDGIELWRRCVELVIEGRKKVGEEEDEEEQWVEDEGVPDVLGASFIRMVRLLIAQRIIWATDSLTTAPGVFDMDEVDELLTQVDNSLKEEPVVDTATLSKSDLESYVDFVEQHHQLHNYLRGQYHWSLSLKNQTVLYEIPNGKAQVVQPEVPNAVKAMVWYAKVVHVSPEDDYLKWIGLQYVLMIGLKIGLLNHEVAWDLWNMSKRISRTISTWYNIDKNFDPHHANEQFFNAYGEPKKGPKRVLTLRQSDVITKPGGGDADVKEALEWVNRTWYEEGVSDDNQFDDVRRLYVGEREEALRFCRVVWREE
ncbi:Stress-induced-phosphoprotein 1 [Rhizophlyctis rosea]|nr:Stress-induced-phosphoprotein 1 [Rhizophlyctis rosea]